MDANKKRTVMMGILAKMGASFTPSISLSRAETKLARYVEKDGIPKDLTDDELALLKEMGITSNAAKSGKSVLEVLDDEEDEEEAPKPSKKPAKKEEAEDDEEDGEEAEEAEDEDKDVPEDDEEDEEEAPKPSKKPAKPAKKEEVEEDGEEAEEDEEEAPKPAKEEAEEEAEEDEEEAPKPEKKPKAPKPPKVAKAGWMACAALAVLSSKTLEDAAKKAIENYLAEGGREVPQIQKRGVLYVSRALAVLTLEQVALVKVDGNKIIHG